MIDAHITPPHRHDKERERQRDSDERGIAGERERGGVAGERERGGQRRQDKTRQHKTRYQDTDTNTNTKLVTSGQLRSEMENGSVSSIFSVFPCLSDLSSCLLAAGNTKPNIGRDWAKTQNP